jgi:nitrite reductase (NO-forming)
VNDEQAANVLTYVMNEWGNNFGDVTAADVKRVRSGAKPAGSNPAE